MAPVALSRLLSLAALAVSYASATTTATPTGASSAPASTPTTPPATPTTTDGLPPGVTGTFPSTPLASLHFTYPSGVVRVTFSLSTFLLTCRLSALPNGKSARPDSRRTIRLQYLQLDH